MALCQGYTSLFGLGGGACISAQWGLFHENEEKKTFQKFVKIAKIMKWSIFVSMNIQCIFGLLYPIIVLGLKLTHKVSQEIHNFLEKVQNGDKIQCPKFTNFQILIFEKYCVVLLSSYQFLLHTCLVKLENIKSKSLGFPNLV